MLFRPGRAMKPVGGPGRAGAAPVGRTARDGSEGVLEPLALFAVTVNLYATASLRPDTTVYPRAPYPPAPLRVGEAAVRHPGWEGLDFRGHAVTVYEVIGELPSAKLGYQVTYALPSNAYSVPTRSGGFGTAASLGSQESTD